MSTPEDSPSGPANTEPETSAKTIQPTIDPNDPPWGVLEALATWMASVFLLFVVPLLCALPYLVSQSRGTTGLSQDALMRDKTYILIIVAGFLPAHVLTLILAWAVASRFGKVSVSKSLGFSWPANFGIWKSTGLAILLLGLTIAILYKFGGPDTELERILRSSRAAALMLAFLATVTAPLMEEVVYRGILYSALQRLAGPLISVLLVTSIFSGLHVFQYWPNVGAITAIALLSLALTVVRARTGRLLPCYVIHLVFNGVQSIIIVVDPYLRSLFQKPQPETVTGIINSLFNIL